MWKMYAELMKHKEAMSANIILKPNVVTINPPTTDPTAKEK